MLLKDGGPKVIAGCTDYYPSLPQGSQVRDLLDISQIAELRGIAQTDQGWRIGAATTWTDILRAPLPPAFDGLKLAAREVGSVQIQNRGTIAGNICNASPAADGVPPLLALQAQVELASLNGTRRMPLSEFITGVRQTKLDAGEMLVALHIPPHSPSATSAFSKLGSRTHLVISIAMVAAVLELKNGAIEAATLAVGSCSPVAQCLPALQAALIGKTFAEVEAMDFEQDGHLAPLAPISDVRGSAEYRMDVVAELCKRVVLTAMQEG